MTEGVIGLIKTVESYRLILPLDVVTNAIAKSVLEATVVDEETGEEKDFQEFDEEDRFYCYSKACGAIVPALLKIKTMEAIGTEFARNGTIQAIEKCIEQSHLCEQMATVIPMIKHGEYEEDECGFMLITDVVTGGLNEAVPVTSLAMFHYDEDGKPVRDRYVFEGRIESMVSSPLFKNTAVTVSYKVLNIRFLDDCKDHNSQY